MDINLVVEVAVCCYFGFGMLYIIYYLLRRILTRIHVVIRQYKIYIDVNDISFVLETYIQNFNDFSFINTIKLCALEWKVTMSSFMRLIYSVLSKAVQRCEEKQRFIVV